MGKSYRAAILTVQVEKRKGASPRFIWKGIFCARSKRVWDDLGRRKVEPELIQIHGIPTGLCTVLEF